MAPHDPDVLVRLPASVRGRRRSAPKIERSSDVVRTRGWLIGSLAGGLGLLAAVLIDLRGGAAIGPQRTISRPHARAGLSCASCHGEERPGPATAEHDPADACVGCHREQRSTRAPHAALLAAKSMRCTTCHAIHTAEGGVAFEPGAVPVRWRNGAERPLPELEPLGGRGWPGRSATDVALVELAACSKCHDPSRANDPMAHCVLAGHAGPTDPVVCFDEHTPLLLAAARADRGGGWGSALRARGSGGSARGPGPDDAIARSHARAPASPPIKRRRACVRPSVGGCPPSTRPPASAAAPASTRAPTTCSSCAPTWRSSPARTTAAGSRCASNAARTAR